MDSIAHKFVFVFLVLTSFLVFGCSYKHHDSVANLRINVSATERDKFLIVLEEFSKDSGFSITQGHMDREGRTVTQFVLDRKDGVRISADDFLQSDRFYISFYALEPNSRWQDSEKLFISRINSAFGGKMQIEEVN